MIHSRKLHLEKKRGLSEANAEKRSIISDKPNDKSPQIAVAGAPETVKGGKKQLRRL